MKKLSIIFALSAVLLTNVMTAVTAYSYGVMKMGIIYCGFSAPAETAFLYAVPFLPAIAACIILAVHFKNKAQA